MADKIKNHEALFSLKRKPILSSYDNLNRTKNFLGITSYRRGGDYNDLSTFLNSSYLDPYFKNPSTNNEDCVRLSNTLFSTNRIYQNLLEYLSNMFLWRYVVVPRKIKGVDSNLITVDYKTTYNKMIEIVEGIKIETTFPKLLLNIFKNGQIFLYASGDKNSKTISTILLPEQYCRATFLTQFGTSQIEFNFSFFDNLKNGNLEKVLALFPKEFTELYNLYIENKKLYKEGWVPLDPRWSTSISMNDAGFPTFLSVFYDIIDYKNYKLNEMDRSTNGLERIIAQEIDMEKTGLDLTELEALHDSMAKSLNQNGSILITTPGNIKVSQIQEERSQENKVLSNAFKTIFDNAGFNNELFSSDTEEGITSSLYRDISYVWKYVEELVNFFNLAINNIFNFKKYQVSLRILPISPYNEKEKLEIYHQNATYGMGILDAIMATGIKQVDLESTIELEQFLDLHNRLKPLNSSHTQSSSTTSEETTTETHDKNNPDENVEESKVEDK